LTFDEQKLKKDSSCLRVMKISHNDMVIGLVIIILVVGGGFLYSMAKTPYCGDGICQDHEFKLCFADCDWCGDGLCKEDEQSLCSLDCDWCGDNYCHTDESCLTCAKDCGSCEADFFCGDLICNPGECQMGCDKDCSLVDCQDGVCDQKVGEDCVTAPNDCRCGVRENCDTETRKCTIITCGNGLCDKNENSINCPADCREEFIQRPETIDPYSNIPIILIHGHTSLEKESVDYSNIRNFVEFQNKLEKDGLYVNKGVLLPSARSDAVTQGFWGRLDKPVSVRTTYYLGVYDDRGSIIGAEDEKSISIYADRIKKTVDILMSYTGKNKVTIIAHSMGGLVAREYVRRHGSKDVDMLITVGTPNHGISGYIDLLCPFGHDGPECQEMKAGSSFLSTLNRDETPGSARYVTIAGDCCITNGKASDETILVESVYLEGATNIVLKEQEVEGLIATLHERLILPSRVPAVYNKIVDLLKGKV
jgi:hypothetical protein